MGKLSPNLECISWNSLYKFNQSFSNSCYGGKYNCINLPITWPKLLLMKAIQWEWRFWDHTLTQSLCHGIGACVNNIINGSRTQTCIYTWRLHTANFHKLKASQQYHHSVAACSIAPYILIEAHFQMLYISLTSFIKSDVQPGTFTHRALLNLLRSIK